MVTKGIELATMQESNIRLRKHVMKIGVVADSHAVLVSDMPEKVIDALASMDLIIHAGDFTTIQVLKGLKRIGYLKAVQGNIISNHLFVLEFLKLS